MYLSHACMYIIQERYEVGCGDVYGISVDATSDFGSDDGNYISFTM